MKFQILHEGKERMRFHVLQDHPMTYEEAETLLYFLQTQESVSFGKVYDRTGDATVEYTGPREDLIELLRHFHYRNVEVPAGLMNTSGRELNNQYQEKLVFRILWRYAKKCWMPFWLRTAITIAKGIGYVLKGVKCLSKGRIEVAVLDATAIGVSLLREDFDTAGSIMFMLGIGELLEDWTHKKSVADLARSMSLNTGKVWLLTEGQEVLVAANEVRTGDRIVIHMGNVIPFDGEVCDGEAMVNQASLTGESVPVQKSQGATVFAGTVLEEGEITVLVSAVGGSSRYEKIVSMIEDSEKLKSEVESKAEHLADRLVPYSLGLTALTYLFSRNATKALSVLMVDYSCALKLAMPISVLSAIREASLYDLTVKGGKYLEAVSEADTIIFDKTGTLTKARPTVVRVVSFNDLPEEENLRIAACLEEHFPHSMAKAVVAAAEEKDLLHEEMHSKVEYIVAHGIATSIDNKRAIIGSAHFVFEDENCQIPEGKQELFDALPLEYSHLYMAIDGRLAAVICIEDPVRREAAAVVSALHQIGFRKVVMMTGDSERTAKAIAQKVGVDEYYAEVLPEDKADYVARTRKEGHKVIMVGDGINDSPALSAANVGIAISDGAEIAREIADITIGSDDLYNLVTLKNLADCLMKRIHRNYRVIVSFNSLLIVLGIFGFIQPTTSAMLHNTSTLLIGLKSMGNLLDE